MPENMEAQLEYGNWIRKRRLITLGLCALGAGALLLLPLGPLARILAAILFIVLLFSFLLPLYAFVMFSQNGGRIQEKFYNLILQKLGQDIKGRVLDIGSGNGVLAVKLAQRCAEVEVLGVDYWGQDWEYSKSICEKNAQIARVEQRVHFRKGDAARLGFDDASFEGAMSNLTFHEVKSVLDKRSVLQEALRVVKPGGSFAFIDYFYDEHYYGSQAELNAFLKGLNLLHFESQPIQDLIAVPALLRHPKILGKVGMISGKK